MDEVVVVTPLVVIDICWEDRMIEVNIEQCDCLISWKVTVSDTINLFRYRNKYCCRTKLVDNNGGCYRYWGQVCGDEDEIQINVRLVLE